MTSNPLLTWREAGAEVLFRLEQVDLVTAGMLASSFWTEVVRESGCI